MENEIKILQNMNMEVEKLQKEYCDKKRELKEVEANLYLFGEEEVKKTLNKDKVSVKDKENFVTLKTTAQAKAVDNAYLAYKYAQREYEIKTLEFKAKNPTAKTII